MFANLLDKRNQQKLGDAIARHDLNAMEQVLARGVKKFRYTLMAPGDFGDGRTQVPAGVFDDPAKLASQVKLPDAGKALLARYGYVDQPLHHAQTLRR